MRCGCVISGTLVHTDGHRCTHTHPELGVTRSPSVQVGNTHRGPGARCCLVFGWLPRMLVRQHTYLLSVTIFHQW